MAAGQQLKWLPVQPPHPVGVYLLICVWLRRLLSAFTIFFFSQVFTSDLLCCLVMLLSNGLFFFSFFLFGKKKKRNNKKSFSDRKTQMTRVNCASGFYFFQLVSFEHTN